MGLTFIIAGLILIGVSWLFYNSAEGRARRAAQWPSVAGVIAASEVGEVLVSNSRMSTPAIGYTYQVGDQALEGNAIRLGQPPLFNKRAKAEAIVARYPAGAPVTVLYDPAAPKTAILEAKFGHTYGLLMLVSFGATLFVLGFVALFLRT